MVILPKPNPCTIKLQPNNNPFSMSSLVSIGTGKHAPARIAIVSTLSISYQTKSLGRFINGNRVLEEPSSRRGSLFADQTLTTRDLGENEGKSGYSTKLKTKQNDHEEFEKEVESVICRLKAVVERIRELEIQKLMGRFKGRMSDEDRILVENTSREIVDRFLGRPLHYLRSGNGDLKEKLKDLKLLIRMLDKLCIEGKPRPTNHVL